MKELLSKFSLKSLRLDQAGATMLEYALIASLVAVVAIGGVTKLGVEAKQTTQMASCHICIVRRMPRWSSATQAWYCDIVVNRFANSNANFVCRGGY